jgi:putative copper resistance protein D
LLLVATNWLQQLCLLTGFGLLTALAVTGKRSNSLDATSSTKTVHQVLVLLGLTFLANCLLIALQAIEMPDEHSSNLQKIIILLHNTRIGQVWSAKMVFVTLAVGVLSLPWSLRKKILYGITFLAVAIIASTFTGHSATSEAPVVQITAHSIHYLGIGLWFGGLVFIFQEVIVASKSQSLCTTEKNLFIQFSKFALPAMSLIIVSGVVLSTGTVGTFPALFGTPYGLGLLTKLACILGILSLAWHIRSALLRESQPISITKLFKLGLIELSFGCLVFLIASILSRTIPAKHDAIIWLLPFRISPEASWENESQQITSYILFAGFVLLLFLSFAYWRRRSPRQRLKYLASFLGSLSLLVGATWSISVSAWHDTYRVPSVPYQTISVASGIRLFKENCSMCHGENGYGDGPLASQLSKPPANLTEPHTAFHTAGDIFWWLTYGKPPGIMPAFRDQLSEDERWDLINYLRILSSGYQSRIIDHRVAPEMPWLGAVDFNFVDQHGNEQTLKDFRDSKSVLLVLFSESPPYRRLEQLADHVHLFAAASAEVIAIPINRIDVKTVEHLPFSVATEGAESIVATYSLMRRTLANPDTRNERPIPTHIEFVIDRFGYIRSKWLPNESNDWDNAAAIISALETLKSEKKIKEPPDDHVH